MIIICNKGQRNDIVKQFFDKIWYLTNFFIYNNKWIACSADTLCVNASQGGQ
jgi:hypothetical protein